MPDLSPTPQKSPTAEPAEPVKTAAGITVTPPTLEALAQQVTQLQAQLSTLQTQFQQVSTTIIEAVGTNNTTATAAIAALQAQVAPLTPLPGTVQTIASQIVNISQAYAKHTHTIQSYQTIGQLGNFGYIVPVLGYDPLAAFDPPAGAPQEPELAKSVILTTDPPAIP